MFLFSSNWPLLLFQSNVEYDVIAEAEAVDDDADDDILISGERTTSVSEG